MGKTNKKEMSENVVKAEVDLEVKTAHSTQDKDENKQEEETKTNKKGMSEKVVNDLKTYGNGFKRKAVNRPRNWTGNTWRKWSGTTLKETTGNALKKTARIKQKERTGKTLQEKPKAGNILQKMSATNLKVTAGCSLTENNLDNLQADCLAKNESSEEKTKANLEEKNDRTAIDVKAEVYLEMKTA